MKKLRQSSVTSLLMLGVLSATLIYSCIFSTIVYSQLGNTLETIRNKSLAEQAYTVAAYLDRAGGIHNSAASGPGIDISSPYQYVVRNSSDERIILHSSGAWLDGFPPLHLQEGQSNYFSFRDPAGKSYLGASVRYASDDKDYVIQIAQREESLRAFSDTLSRIFLQRMSLFGIPFLFMLMVVIALSIKLIMTPLTKAMRQAREISFAKPDIRLNESIFPKEILPLASAVNDALDRLEKGIVAQKDFVANAAHELRTPLSILRTHVDLMTDKDAAERMGEDVDAMARLVSQLLDTARLESPERLETHRVDLAEIVRHAGKTIWPLMLKDGRAFDVTGIDAPVYVDGNFDAIARALRNILENALNHTPKGSPITLSLEGRAITIRDRGKGVSKEEREKIFGKFSRKDMQQGNGAGLGLFIVRRIMDMHGGTVDVADAPGGGAAFTLRFPESFGNT